MAEQQFDQFKRLQKAALDKARDQAVATNDALALILIDQIEEHVLAENGEIDRAIEEWARQTLDPFNEAPAHLRPDAPGSPSPPPPTSPSP